MHINAYRLLEISLVHVKRSLVVKDEPYRLLYLRAFIYEGFQTDVVTNGGLTKEILSNKGYSVVIIDIGIPIMDSSQLYQYINYGTRDWQVK